MACPPSFDLARCGAAAILVAWTCACSAGKEAPAPSLAIAKAEPAAPTKLAPAPPSTAASALLPEIVPGRTVGDTTCQTDADCVVGTPSESCCACCPEAPRATSRAWLAWFTEFRPKMCASQRCGAACDGVGCEKVEDATAFRAVCRARSCALARAKP
jgi:hypothetical protein